MSYNYGPRIVTDGLLVCYDAGNNKSYPGSGNTWYNLANTNDCTLSGATFTSVNGGGISYDGINDTSSYSIAVPKAFTVITIAKSLQTYWNEYAGLGSLRGPNGFIIHNNPFESSNRTISLYICNSLGNFTYLGDMTDITNILIPSMYTFTTNGTTNHKGYYNTTLKVNATTSDISRSSSPSTESVNLGSDFNNARFNNIVIYAHYMYNRELTQSEISQNYNALRGRFGL